VKISTANIATRQGCEELIETAQELGPVGGIFNLAVVIQNATIQDQSEESFRRSFEPKALSTIHLDAISRSSCPKLDFFIFISSTSCGRGNTGQTNYGFSNSVGEKIIEKRRLDNLPGKAIQYGPVGDVGLLANYKTEAISLFGFLKQSMRSCLEIWDEILLRDEAVFSSSLCAGKTSGKNNNDMFTMFVNALGITDHRSVDLNQTLANFGLDSLSGVEVQQIFLRELGISVSMKEFRKKTFKEIRDICQKKD
jgi:fatty acid synthase, animal type